jgi:hypothetical protein
MGGGLAVGLKVGNVGFNSGTGEVDNGVEATGNANAKLALGEHVGRKISRGFFEDRGGKETPPGETDAEGAEFGKVGGIFVEGGEVVGSEGSGKGGGE